MQMQKKLLVIIILLLLCILLMLIALLISAKQFAQISCYIAIAAVVIALVGVVFIIRKNKNGDKKQ